MASASLDGNRGGEEHQRNGQAAAAAAEQLAQLASRPDRPLVEELVDRVAQEGRLLGRAGRAVEMDDQRQRRGSRQVAAPLDDELRGLGVEIALLERRRIDGVEELTQFRDADLDRTTAGWQVVTRPPVAEMSARVASAVMMIDRRSVRKQLFLRVVPARPRP